jgi:hypothetical protein
MLEDLTDRLAADLRPTSAGFVSRRLLAGMGGGAVVSTALVAVLMGLRPDMLLASLTLMFWIKLAYTLALAGVALWSAERLARPDGAGWRRGAWLALPLLLVAGLAIWQLAQAPAPMRGHMVMGGSAKLCPWCILAFSIPPLIGLIWAMRALAPANLSRAGAMIGMAAGGVGASAYALHCPESTAPFLAIWYTLGIAGAGVLGLLLGPRVLRW